MFDNLFLLLGPAWSLALLLVLLLGAALVVVLHTVQAIGDRGVRRAARRVLVALARLRTEFRRAMLRAWDAPSTR